MTDERDMPTIGGGRIAINALVLLSIWQQFGEPLVNIDNRGRVRLLDSLLQFLKREYQ
jgi:hypothetical protein